MPAVLPHPARRIGLSGRALLLGFLLAAAPAVAAPSAPAVPRFTHPGAGQTYYFLLTDRFANGRTDNDTGHLPGGADDHGFDPTRISHYHGGDFAGLTARLDYLQGLGVTDLWITPPFTNQAMLNGSAGYHGYWITDFLHVDPHLGTDGEFMEFIRQAHARHLRVTVDIVVNHTGDVIRYPHGATAYVDQVTAPLRDARGRPIDERAAAWNGLGDPAAFPALSAETSFAYRPEVAPAWRHLKQPEWLNDVTLYHNRGHSTFRGPSSIYGDFGGLDDVMTEHPRVVQGFTALFGDWLERAHLDGFRIDTVRHVNAEFWQAFMPAIRARARAVGRPDFLSFGEVANDLGDVTLLSEFSTNQPLDATLDFPFRDAARAFVSRGGPARAFADFIAQDDLYTDHDSNVHSSTTFLGNHDGGRFGYYLRQDNPHASAAELAALVRLGHGLLLLSRGQPVLYYGDEQGMVGRGGDDQQAREDMFAAKAPPFRDAPLLATTRTGADDKFDPHHPFYRLIAGLNALRASTPALRTGAMIMRDAGSEEVVAFSRIDRRERVEYLVALNHSRTGAVAVSLPTAQAPGARLRRVFDSRTPEQPGDETVTADALGKVAVTLPRLGFAVWRADRPLAAADQAPVIALVAPASGAKLEFTSREVDGQVINSRQEIRAEVTGGDGVAEVTFLMTRASRPGQFELLGVDDAPPYRVFWRPPPDLAPGDELTFFATVDDLRGHRASTRIDRLQVAPHRLQFGIRGAEVPRLTRQPAASVTAQEGETQTLAVEAAGTAPLEYQWLRDGMELPGATEASLGIRVTPATAGTYHVLVRNRAGTVLSAGTEISIARRPGSH